VGGSACQRGREPRWGRGRCMPESLRQTDRRDEYIGWLLQTLRLANRGALTSMLIRDGNLANVQLGRNLRIIETSDEERTQFGQDTFWEKLVLR
jgi:hypothetical protein